MRGILLLAAASLLAAGPSLVWQGADVNLLGAPSSDGAWLSYVRAGELAIRDLRTGGSVTLTREAAVSRQFAYFSVMSRDGANVAYAWFNNHGFYELRVISAKGGEPRVLYSNEEAGFVQPCAWTPDGKQILTLLFRKDNISQIVMMPVDGGAPRTLRSLNWVYPKRMDLSPDGRYIVYDSFASQDGGDRTLYLLAADGSRETRLMERPGNHLFPLWTPDGEAVVFASDQGEGMGLWKLSMKDGVPIGDPYLLRAGLGRFVPLGVTAQGVLYYGVRSGGSDVYVTGNAQPVSLLFPSRNRAPAWSPDGKQLAYLSRRGSENFGQESRVIVIRAVEGGAEKEIAPKLAHAESIAWTPDGKAILVRGSDRQGRGGLYQVDIATSSVRPLVWDEAAGYRGLDGAVREGQPVYALADTVRTRDEVLFRCPNARAVTSDGGRIAALCGEQTIRIQAKGETADLPSPVPAPVELTWAPGRPSLLVGDGRKLWRVELSGSAQPVAVPEDRIPGVSLHPNGTAVAYTAGSARSEIWCLPLGK